MAESRQVYEARRARVVLAGNGHRGICYKEALFFEAAFKRCHA